MKHRLIFTGKKLIRMALLLLGVSLAAFLLMSASPLDPLQTNVGQAALGTMSQEQIAKLEEYWGVNDPPLQRYLGWLGDFVRGDMGTSLLYRQPVSQVIGQRLQNSLWLMAFAWVFSGLLGLTLGILCEASTLLDTAVIKILILGILALAISGVGGLVGGWVMYLIKKKNFNPVIGIAGVSCVPTTAKLAQHAAADENPFAVILPVAMGANICGVITSAIAAGVFVTTIGLVG